MNRYSWRITSVLNAELERRAKIHEIPSQKKLYVLDQRHFGKLAESSSVSSTKYRMESSSVLQMSLFFYVVFVAADNSQNNSSISTTLPLNSSESEAHLNETEVASFIELINFHVENRTAAEGASNYDDYQYDMLASSYSIDEETVEEKASDYDFGDNDRARWSYAPAYFENRCRESCLDLGKPFSRLLGVRCQCLCPLNAPTLGLCESFGKCDKYCASLTFYKGGDCVYNNICFCYCKGAAPYDVSRVYS